MPIQESSTAAFHIVLIALGNLKLECIGWEASADQLVHGHPRLSAACLSLVQHQRSGSFRHALFTSQQGTVKGYVALKRVKQWHGVILYRVGHLNRPDYPSFWRESLIAHMEWGLYSAEVLARSEERRLDILRIRVSCHVTYFQKATLLANIEH